MSQAFARLRQPLRAASRQIARPSTRNAAPTFRASFRRFNSTEAPKPPKSDTGLYAGIAGGALLAGIGFYYYSQGMNPLTAAKSGAQAAKVATNFVPSKEDYQKVRCRIRSHVSVAKMCT